MNVPAFAHFAGAYLHQDWHEEFPDEWSALDEFLSGEPAYADALVPEIDRLLQLPDRDLKENIDRLDVNYVPEGGYRAWLEQVANYVRKHTA